MFKEFGEVKLEMLEGKKKILVIQNFFQGSSNHFGL